MRPIGCLHQEGFLYLLLPQTSRQGSFSRELLRCVRKILRCAERLPESGKGIICHDGVASEHGGGQSYSPLGLLLWFLGAGGHEQGTSCVLPVLSNATLRLG